MNVLVVGGAGYIGSHVVLGLLEEGHQVTVFDNLSTGHRANVPAEASLVVGDLLEGEALGTTVATGGFEAIVHLAALKAAGLSMEQPELFAHHNIWGSLRLLKLATEHHVEHFVFSSSAAVYGDPDYLPIDEAHPKDPTNYYGFSKFQIEEQLAWFARLRNFRFASLRYFNAAGYDPQGRVPGMERETTNLIPLILEVAQGQRPFLGVFGTDYDTPDGTCIRDYVHVSDLAKAHVLALAYLREKGRNLICNLGTDCGHSVLDVLQQAREITGHAIPHRNQPRRPGDPPRLIASSKLARQTLGWEPRFTDLATMLRTAWQVYHPGQAPITGP